MSWRGRLSANIQEVRLLLNANKNAKEGEGVRQWLSQHYGTTKALNPGLPILVRPGQDVSNRLFARFDFGKEEEIKLDNLSAAQVDATLQKLCEKGATMPRSAESKYPDHLQIVNGWR